MDEDFDDGIDIDDGIEIDERHTFNSNLMGYLNYEREPINIDVNQPLYLMNIDVAGTVLKCF